MVKKLSILGFILVAVAAAGMVWAGTFSGAVPAPTPMVMPAGAPPAAFVGPACPPAKVKAAPCPPPKKLTTTIQVQMKYPRPAMPPPPACGPVCGGPPPPIPVAVPMWKFIVPWPPFVYYLPVE